MQRFVPVRVQRILPFIFAATIFTCFLTLIQPSPTDFVYDEIAEFNLCVTRCGNWKRANFTNITALGPKFSESTCSAEATARGSNQHVTSFSFYGSLVHNRQYFEGIDTNAQLMREHYPDWVMRLYHNVEAERSINLLCQLKCTYPDILDLCFVGNIPGFGNLLDAQQNMWRFLPLSDMLVNVMVSRDLDSMLNKREVAAVNEWLKSGRPLHIMRDNPSHSVPMLAGMWGARVAEHLEVWRNTLQQMLYSARKAGKKGRDQKILAQEVWKLALIPGWALQHDSYFCSRKEFRRGLTLPFPTRRTNETLNFVGARRTIDETPIANKCPSKCRKHPDWITC